MKNIHLLCKWAVSEVYCDAQLGAAQCGHALLATEQLEHFEGQVPGPEALQKNLGGAKSAARSHSLQILQACLKVLATVDIPARQKTEGKLMKQSLGSYFIGLY